MRSRGMSGGDAGFRDSTGWMMETTGGRGRGGGAGVETGICSCSVLSAKWPLVCSEHVIKCVEQSDFQPGKQNSLQASHSSCFTRGLGWDAHTADNGRKMPTSQVGRSPRKRSLGPCNSYTQGTAAGTVGWDCGCTKSLQLWATSAISKTLVLSERSLGSQR